MFLFAEMIFSYNRKGKNATKMSVDKNYAYTDYLSSPIDSKPLRAGTYCPVYCGFPAPNTVPAVNAWELFVEYKY